MKSGGACTGHERSSYILGKPLTNYIQNYRFAFRITIFLFLAFSNAEMLNW